MPRLTWETAPAARAVGRFGCELQRQREARQMSQAQLGALAGYDRTCQLPLFHGRICYNQRSGIEGSGGAVNAPDRGMKGSTSMQRKRITIPLVRDDGTALVPLSRGLYAIIDALDVALVSAHTWHAITPSRTRWYAATNRPSPERGQIYMHRLLMAAPSGIEVDHVNGDGLDNRRANLRLATRQENAANARMMRNNTSGYCGVSWAKGSRKWAAYIRVHCRKVHLGLFETPIQAAAAYNEAARRYRGDFARLNDVEPRHE